MADYLNLRAEILSDIQSDPQVKAAVKELNNKIKNGNAKYADAVDLSKSLGRTTSKYLKANSVEVTDELLGEFADEVMAPVYRAMQNTSLAASKEVQRIFNKKAGLGINPVDVKNDESRLTHIVDRFKEAESLDTVSFLMGEGVAENIARGAVTDSLRANASAMDRAGMKSYIIRQGSGCCKWCADVAGTYAIDDAPKDVWRFHKGCTCTLEYKANNKHTKITFNTDDNGKMVKNTENYEREESEAALKQDTLSDFTKKWSELCKEAGIKYNEVGLQDEILSEEKIINLLSGGDLTDGSCSSLSMCYLGQKKGLNVVDFRGGESTAYFADKNYKIEFFKQFPESFVLEKGKNSTAVGKTLLSKVEKGKEYIVNVGCHSSVVRKTDDGVLQYLELQSATNSGWHNIDNIAHTLTKRFGTNSKGFRGLNVITGSIIDIEKFEGTNDLRYILGYCNTSISNQMKGARGYEK